MTYVYIQESMVYPLYHASYTLPPPSSKQKQKYSTPTIPYITITAHPFFCITPIIHTTTLYFLNTYLQLHPHSNTSHLSKIDQASIFNNVTPPLLSKMCPPITLINDSSHLSFFLLE